jgi:type 1 fimbria pilin
VSLPPLSKIKMFNLLACAFLVLSQGQAAAVSIDNTRVYLAGDILDTPCTIDSGSREQTISMGKIPLGVIARDGVGQAIPFSIQLKDCDLARVDHRLPDWKGVRIIFGGISDGRDFSIRGTAAGVALRITDAEGHIAAPGTPLPSSPLMTGDQSLNFTMQLVSDHKPLRKGEYHAVIQFGLSYF